jgi:sugar phosphate isomerase/epimerase
MAPHDRRTFLATLGGGALALAGVSKASALVPAFSEAHRRLPRVGIQLYTLRRQAVADLSGTLVQIAKIGYKEVEFWGSFSIKPPEIRKILDQNGLTVPSGHYGFPRMPDGFATIFDNAKVMGQEWATFPSIPSGPSATVDDWKRIAGQFNDAGARARAAGLRFAFHNHDAEFKKIGDIVPFEVLLKETDPAVVSFELDLHWAYAGSADPIDLFHRYPNRFTMVHVKDSAGSPTFKQTDVGAGTYPWAKIFDVTTQARVQHYFVESDDATDPMAFAKTSFDYLQRLEF